MEEIIDLAVTLFCYVTHAPLFWVALVFASFYLIERLDLGIHCFRWTSTSGRDRSTSGRDRGFCNGSVYCRESKLDGICALQQTADSENQDRNGKLHSNGHVCRVPPVFHNFIQKRLIPSFHSQCQDGEHNFAVLVLSTITSVHDIESVKFRQVTFNGMPLVDPRRITYPQSYRYENYVVSRPDGSDHPEAMIMRQVPALIKAYKMKERCYIRNPTPKFGVLYSSTMPCSACTKLIIKSLSGVCAVGVILAYTHRNEEKGSLIRKSHQMLTSAGFVVVKVDAG